MGRYELLLQTPVEVYAYLTHMLTEHKIPWDCDMDFTPIGQWTVVKVHCASNEQRHFVDDTLFEQAFKLAKNSL